MDDLERKKCVLILKNKQLWQGIQKLSDRQAVLEKYLEVRRSLRRVERFRINKDRMVYALQIPTNEVTAAICEGKRSPIYKRMLRIVKVAIDHWKRYGWVKKHHRLNPTVQDLNVENFYKYNPSELEELGLTMEFKTGVIVHKRLDCCLRCCDDSHVTNDKCRRLVENPSPELQAVLEARIQKLKDRYKDDPLLSLRQKYTLQRLTPWRYMKRCHRGTIPGKVIKSILRYTNCRTKPKVGSGDVNMEQSTGIFDETSEQQCKSILPGDVVTWTDEEEEATENQTTEASN